jgi:hypothetical protein
MNDNVKTKSRTELEVRCLKEIRATEAWDPLPMLRAVCREISLPAGFDGDYKDAIADKSARLSDRLREGEALSRTSAERRMYIRLLNEASKRGLLNGYDCPRATSAAWAALNEA